MAITEEIHDFLFFHLYLDFSSGEIRVNLVADKRLT